MKKKIQDVDKKIHDTRNFVGIHDFNALTKKTYFNARIAEGSKNLIITK